MRKTTRYSGSVVWAGTGRRAASVACCIFVMTLAAGYVRAAGEPGTALSVEGLVLGEAYPYRSPLALTASADGKVLYVIQHTGQRVEAVEATSGRIRWSTLLEGAPSGLALSAEGRLLYVTFGLDRGHVAAIATGDGKIDFRLPTGHTPVAPVLSADGKTLYVGNRFQNELVAYDLETRTVRGRLAVPREPIAAALSPDGALLVVACHLPDQSSTAELVAARVWIVETGPFEAVASVALPNGSTGVRDVCISPDGKYAYVTHTLGRFLLPTTQLERGWMNTSALSIVDLERKEKLTTVLLDDVDRGAANPWGVAVSADGKILVVAHSGTHELSRIDREALHQKIERIAAGERGGVYSRLEEELPNDLSFLVDVRRRIQLPGNGPRGLAIAGDQVWVAEYFSDRLVAIHMDPAEPSALQKVPMGNTGEITEIRRGEIAFFDALNCFQGWQSCASCHPDIRADGLNWDLLNDGIGNPKNNRSLLFSHATPPVMITGIRASAEVAVRAGFRFIQFAVPPEEIPASVDAFLKALEAVPSPSLENGRLSASAARGKVIFEKAACIHCHSGPYYTEGKKYDVGIGPDELGIREFVTPTLREVWRTAPYLFDGRAATMREVFDTHNPQDRHGKTSGLTDQEIDDLAEFVLSL